MNKVKTLLLRTTHATGFAAGYAFATLAANPLLACALITLVLLTLFAFGAVS